MRIFISGGCKNGKSSHAQTLAVKNRAVGAPLYYVATMKPVDAEDDMRIARHVEDRKGMGFITVEFSCDIKGLLDLCDVNGSFLLDSTTALLSNEMFRDGHVHHSAGEKLLAEICDILERIENIVIVSDYIYSDAAMYDRLINEYRRNLAMLDRMCANRCDVVLEACCGNMVAHKGNRFYETL